MNNEFNRRHFIRIAGVGAIAVLAPGCMESREKYVKDSSRHPVLAGNGDDFTFGICSDPQVSWIESTEFVAANARRTQLMAVEEMNRMNPRPAFVIFLGDLVNVPDDKSFDNFKDCIKDLQPEPVLVHGNHDTHPPYEKYIQMQREVNGVEDAFYSFDVGRWHFVILPCNFPGTSPVVREWEEKMLTWLRADMEKARNRPTMVFEHLHAMPQGLTQLEWYNFPLRLRMDIMNEMTRYGNVKYYFNGHVHNGIKASVKTAWRYKGIRFTTCPTIIQSRNFGEEYPAYEEGLKTGGYYMLVDVKGRDVRLKARLAGNENEFVYPPNHKVRIFRDEIEPRWFRRLPELPARSALVNGDFEQGLKGWQPTYRYKSDENPGFAWEVSKNLSRSGGKSLHIFTRMKPPVSWASDENTELYQVVKPPKGRPILKASYFLARDFYSGGGYIRLIGISKEEFRFMMMFKWGENEHRSHIMARGFGYALEGAQVNWLYLQQIGQKKQGMYWDMPRAIARWHELSADVVDLYDRTHGPGAYETLGIDKLVLGLGTWVNNDEGSQSGTYFDRIRLEGSNETMPSTVNHQPLRTDDEVFTCTFGQELEDQVRKAREAEKKS